MYENMGMAVADQTQISAVNPGSPADPKTSARIIVEGYSPVLTAGGGALIGYYFYKKNPIVGAIVGAIVGFIGGRLIKGFTPLPLIKNKPEPGQEDEQEQAF